MSDLIRRSDARSDVICLHTYQFHYGKYPDRGEWLMLVDKREVLNAINAIPSADRPRGEWIDMGDFEQCSVCKGTRLKEFQSYYGKVTWIKTPYCPSCGARMKGADDEF